MLQISKKISICLTSLFILVTCASCKTDDTYKIKDYLNYLAIKSGIGTSQMIETNFEELLDWQVVDQDDENHFEDELDYQYLSKTLNNLLDSNKNTLDNLIQLGLVDNNVKPNKKVDKQTAQDIVDKAVYIINNKSYPNNYEYKLRDDKNIAYSTIDNTYQIIETDDNNQEVIRQAQFEEVFDYFDISDSYEIDFSDAEVIPYQDEQIETSYVNNMYNLLASKNHVFSNNGFRISYTLNNSGISVHVSKDINGFNVYGDLAINKVKPSFKYTYEKGDLNNCYFSLSMNTTEELGVSDGKYGKYYLKFKDLDGDSFLSKLKSMAVGKNDYADAIIPICQIKTPIPNVPTAFINLDLLLKFSISGKVELVLYNTHNCGFEIKQGKARFFYDHKDDVDSIARASAKACLGINVGLDAVNFRLCDVELDGGIKAELKSTLHLYDSDGNIKSSSSDIAYSTLEQVSKENPNVAVCGDVSFCWLFDVIINTSKSTLYKMGFSKTFNILDDDNQVFGNLHHIENGQFVEKCTRKSTGKINYISLDVSAANKITLNSYAEVLLQNQTFEIVLKSLPSGYSESDIRYQSLDSKVASVNSGIITAKDLGSCKIKVYTKDNKYNTYINVLVSTG